MDTIEQIITDEQLNNAWGSATFGNVDKRELIANTLLKCACGFKTGHTATCIVNELGLTKSPKPRQWVLTPKGMHYLWLSYWGGKSL
jgi:hypothetical protein